MASRTRAKLNNLNDRAREVGQAGILTLADIDALKAFYNFACLKCGKSPAISPDHVIPLSKGGANAVENLQLLCENCNKSKGDDETDYRGGKVLTSAIVEDFAKSEGDAEQARKYRKHNWEELQFEYVTTEKSLRDLAEEYEMDSSLLFKRAASERWLKNRENFASKLQADVQEQAKVKEVSSRVMILEAARIALEEWKQNDEPTELADLAKILQLAAQVEGLELNRSTLTVKDWRDVAGTNETDTAELETYFSALAGSSVSSVDDGTGNESGAGWTD